MSRQEIEQLIQDYPKHYVQKIKANSELREWVESNHTVDCDHWPTMIYSAINNVSNICEKGKSQTIKRISLGFTGCGPARDCECTRDKIASKTKESLRQLPTEKKQSANEKRKATMVEKYGYEFNSQRPDIHHVWCKPKMNEQTHTLLSDPEWVEDQYVVQRKSLTEISNELGVYYGTVGEYVRKHGFHVRRVVSQSIVEKQVADFLNDIGVEYATSDWDTLDTKELDIVVPSKNLAIEVNGLYWHSYHPSGECKEDKYRHLCKTNEAESKNINLVHITDWEWNNRQTAVKSLLQSQLKLNKKIGARKTKLLEVSASQCRNFLNENHIQGFAPAKKHIVLVHDDKIVMACSIGKNRFSKNSYDEVIRLATAQGVTVVGGLSKIIKHLDSPLVSYVDRDKFNGSGYESVGFVRRKTTSPGYFWTDGNVPISRYRCQKHRLSKWLTSYDSEKSESDNMFYAGYRRYWNCGNWVYVLE